MEHPGSDPGLVGPRRVPARRLPSAGDDRKDGGQRSFESNGRSVASRERRATPQARAPRRSPSTTTSYAIRQMRKFARKTHAQKAEFFARMNHHIIVLRRPLRRGAGDRAPPLAAAKRIAAAKGWLRPAGYADGGVVAAVAPHAAVAMQRLRAVDASRGSASSAARAAVAPESDVVMVDASTTRTRPRRRRWSPTTTVAMTRSTACCSIQQNLMIRPTPAARRTPDRASTASLDKRNPETFDAQAAQRLALDRTVPAAVPAQDAR